MSGGGYGQGVDVGGGWAGCDTILQGDVGIEQVEIYENMMDRCKIKVQIQMCLLYIL